jgi:hypothetical protein
MSEAEIRPGMCVAYGCPLFATVAPDGRWVCFCHAGRSAATNDPVTAVLNANAAIVNAVVDTRRFGYTDEWETVKRGIAKALREANRADLLPGEEDCRNGSGQPEMRSWLQRLERELIRLTAGVGEQRRFASTISTAPVIGPTHAMQHYSETES